MLTGGARGGGGEGGDGIKLIKSHLTTRFQFLLTALSYLAVLRTIIRTLITLSITF